MERPETDLCELDSATGGLGDQCAIIQLDQSEGLRLPSLLPSEGLSIEDNSGEIASSVSMPVLAEPALVSDTIGISMRHPNCFHSETGSVDISERSSAPVMSEPLISSDRLEVIRNRFRNDGLSEQVINAIIAGSRTNTLASYQSAWNSWKDWCHRLGHNPLSNSLGTVLQFFSIPLRTGNLTAALMFTAPCYFRSSRRTGNRISSLREGLDERSVQY